MVAAQLFLNLVHLYGGQPLGQRGLLHIITGLVVLAGRGAFCWCSRVIRWDSARAKRRLLLPFRLLGASLLQREAQCRAVEAQQPSPF